MTRLDALADLIAKVEAGETLSGNTEFWALAETAFARRSRMVGDMAKAFHGSLEAAKALHDAVLPEYAAIYVQYGPLWIVYIYKRANLSPHDAIKRIDAQIFGDGPDEYTGTDPDLARASLLADLRALHAQENTP